MLRVRRLSGGKLRIVDVWKRVWQLRLWELRRFRRGFRLRRQLRAAWKLQVQPLGLGVGMAIRKAWFVLTRFAEFARFIWFISVRRRELFSRFVRGYRVLSVWLRELSPW